MIHEINEHFIKLFQELKLNKKALLKHHKLRRNLHNINSGGVRQVQFFHNET